MRPERIVEHADDILPLLKSLSSRRFPNIFADADAFGIRPCGIFFLWFLLHG